ncbi:lytB protein [Agrobacterium tumefaciens]|nr:lytB protein [Agrobacterium tumefaciens]
MNIAVSKPPLTIRLCGPRGFCAGVDRAIQIVVLALKAYGAPVYVRHEIVHNRYVVEGLEAKGAIFVEELHEIPAEHREQPVVFSAHGVPKSVPEDAQARNLFYLDATCPLVSKVHKQAMRHQRLGRHVVLIGHAGHPEVIGTMGQLPEGTVSLVETVEDAGVYEPVDRENLGFVTQTTLSVDDTAGVIARLQERFPAIQAPAADSICYATTNRQDAVKQAAPGCDLFIVVGAPIPPIQSGWWKWRCAPAPNTRCWCSGRRKSTGMRSATSARSAFRPVLPRRRSSLMRSSRPSRHVSIPRSISP